MSNQLDATIAKRLDISVKQNQTFDATITFDDEDGNPIDLTGVVFKLSVRQDGCDASCACAGDSNFNQVFKQDFIPTYPGSGQLQFNDIVRLAVGNYKYDLLGEWPDQGRKYLLMGSFKVKKSFSQITV
jgi:hypothetical protein